MNSNNGQQEEASQKQLLTISAATKDRVESAKAYIESILK